MCLLYVNFRVEDEYFVMTSAVLSSPMLYSVLSRRDCDVVCIGYDLYVH